MSKEKNREIIIKETIKKRKLAKELNPDITDEELKEIKLSKKERQDIIKKEASKSRKSWLSRIFIAALGFLGGFTVGKKAALEPAKTTEESTTESELEQSVKEEINNLKNSESILTYIKEMVVNELNQKNGTNLAANDITIALYDTTTYYYVYDDVAENGEPILRGLKDASVNFRRSKSSSTSGFVLEVTYSNSNGETVKDASFCNSKDGTYPTIYSIGTDVATPVDNFLTEDPELARVIQDGIDYYSMAVRNEDTKGKYNNECEKYKEEFEAAVVDYRESREEENLDSQENETTEMNSNIASILNEEYPNYTFTVSTTSSEKNNNVSENSNIQTSSNSNISFEKQIEDDEER